MDWGSLLSRWKRAPRAASLVRLFAFVLVASCNTTTLSPTPSAAPYSAAEFWGYLSPGGDNVEHYRSLRDMVHGADGVVVGAVMEVTPDVRHKGQDLSGGAFATITIRVDRILHGSINRSGAGDLNLSVYMTDPAQYARFAAGVPAGRAMLFVRNIGSEARSLGHVPLADDDSYYRVVSDQGVIRDVNGSPLPTSATDDFLLALKSMSFDELIQDVSQL